MAHVPCRVILGVPRQAHGLRERAMNIRKLDQTACVEVLKANRLAHLACASDGQPYVVPIHYAIDEHHIYSFSIPGQKIDWMRVNPKVCVQVEEYVQPSQWRSVIVNGTFEELHDSAGYAWDLDHAWKLLSQHASWWEPGAVPADPAPRLASPLYVFYRISLDAMSGREATGNAADGTPSVAGRGQAGEPHP